jgi:hypothetical protein
MHFVERILKAFYEYHLANDQSNEDKRHRERVAALHKIEQTYAKAHENDNRRESSKRTRDIITIILLVFTTGFTGLTYCSFRTQLDVMKETEIHQLMAYVDYGNKVVCGIADAPLANSGSVASCNVVWENYGETPANDVRIYGRTIIREFPLGPEPLPARTKPPMVNRIAPKSVIAQSIPSEETVSEVQHNAIRDNTAAFYTYGLLTYWDVFGGFHCIHFRITYINQSFSWTAEGNDTNCPDANELSHLENHP